ncbi:MAG: carboxypeptidase-like regulatory domain-containing protein, partial [Candidatus Desantisbacteria bacterium]
MIKKGKGSFKLTLFYTGTQSINSEGIRLTMSDNGRPFYTIYRGYSKEWAPPITAAVKTDNHIYYQGDYVNISLVVNAINLPLGLRELTFDNAIGDMVIRDSSNNIVFQQSRQNLINTKTVTLVDNGAKILLQSTWLADKQGEYVLEGWLNKSNIYPQIQCVRLKFEVQQMRYGILSGKIIDTVTKQPVQNAAITIGKYTTATDKNGDYLFTDVEAGVYVLAVQAKGYQPYKKEQVTIKRGEQRQDVSITSAKELQFEVVLDKEVFGVDEPITAMAVLRCSGTKAVTVSGLSLEAESLLLEIETLSSNHTVRYIGPFSSGLPTAITLKPGEQISLKLDLGQIAFGNKLELVSGYKISSRGKYALKATYNSWGNQPKRWIGTYQANTIWFEIGTSTTVNNQPNPNEGITAEEVVIPQPQELPASIVQSSDWEMQIAAQDKQITNTAILGMYSTANDGFDAEFDEPLPPAPADNSCIQIYFPHQNWGMIFENFSRDIRGYSSDAVWSFQVKTPSNDTTAALSFSGLPNGYDIILKGIDDNRSWDLRTTDKCDISGRTLYRFELSLKACSTVSTGHTEHTAQTELSHTFGSGWNLISIPVGSNQQASNIFKGISTYYLYEYNHSRQGYGEASMITNGNA